MACDNCKDAPGFYCPVCAPTTPAKLAVCDVCQDATCPCGKVVLRTDAELIDALRACRWILSERALAAEKQRDALRAAVARVRRELGDRCRLGCTDRFCVTVTRLHDILDATEASNDRP